MIVKILLFIFSLLLDGIMPNIFKNVIFTFSLVYLINLSFNHKEENYIIVILLGLLYDLLYTNGIILNVFCFLIIYYISNLLSNRNNSFIKRFLIYNLMILTYFIISNLLVLNINNNLIIKISRGLFVNYLYYLLVYIFMNIFSIKYFNKHNN